MIPKLSIVTAPGVHAEPLAVKKQVAALQLGISRTTFRQRYIDTGRIIPNANNCIRTVDLKRVDLEDARERERKVAAKLRRCA